MLIAMIAMVVAVAGELILQRLETGASINGFPVGGGGGGSLQNAKRAA
jgi:hypothetical protein